MLKHHSLVSRIGLPLGGLIYILALGYASYLVSDGLSPLQTTILGLAYAIVAGLYLVVALFALLDKQDIMRGLLQRFEHFWDGKSFLRGVIFSLILLLPVFLVFTELTRGVMQNLWFRFLVFLPLVSLAAFFWPFSEPQKYGQKFLATSIFLGFAFLAWLQLRWVIDYPFTLSWSEGNRFYDYSLIFGKSLYQYDGELEVPYFSPGRYGLWGFWFLVPGLPIWFHRLWNAILWIVPPALLGWFAGRAIKNRVFRFLFALWIALFLSQGPIYAPILLAAIFILAFNRVSLTWRVASTAVASFYAGLSRWTWAVAPGMWGVLLELGEHYPERKGSWFRRLWPAILIGLAGSLPGLLANWERFVQPQESTMSLSQPLLWYRLFPNETFSTGILLGIINATGALVILMIALLLIRKWHLTGFQILAIAAALMGTFIVGTVVSTKIGGGSNLHNYDMYLITLIVIMMIYLDQGNSLPSAWPLWMRVLCVIAILIPVWHILRQGEPSHLPPREEIEAALLQVQDEVAQAATEGEVLFMDHRQLLTFGYIKNIDLIPEYEKKYMMDQAMAGNKVYFNDFYEDLENNRFALIVSEPLFVSRRDESHEFGEENNAYVRFISKYVLCYYEPDLTFNQLNTQLLVPREGPVDCK